MDKEAALRSSLRGWIALTTLIAGIALCASPLEARLGSGIQVIESDETGVTLQLGIDSLLTTPVQLGGRAFHYVQYRDFLTTQEVGLPQLPYTSALLGVPFGRTVKVRVVSNETASLAGLVPAPVPRPFVRDGDFPTPAVEFAIDEAFYSGRSSFPGEFAKVNVPSTVRHQRIVPVFLFPIQYDAGSREVVYSRTLVVRVDFVPETSGDAARQTLDTEPMPSFELNAEGLYQGLIMNYEQAKYWRRKPISRVTETPFQVAQGVSEYKIPVRASGVYRVNYAGIAGLSSAYPVGQVRLFEKYYQEGDPSPFKQRGVPVQVVDTDSDGLFDGTDYLVFYGLSFRDRFPTDIMEQRYSYENVYWLTVGASDGLGMAERSSWRDSSSPYQPESFLHVEKVERDSLYLDFASRLDVDYYLWTADWPPTAQLDLPFGVFAPDSTKDWRVRARYQGYMSRLHYITALIVNSHSQTDTLFSRAGFGPSTPSTQAEVILDTGFTVPGSVLSTGLSHYRYRGERLESGIFTDGSGSYLDWFEVSYYKKFVASRGRLSFNSAGMSGELQFTIGGFPSADILMYDVTDSLNPVRLTVDASQITAQGSAYQLVFRDSVGLLPKRYEALVVSVIPQAPSVVLDSPSSLSTSGVGKDYFIVTYDGFASSLAPLVSKRASQGHGVEVASLSDVFDEFNGGNQSASAIKKYMKYAFSKWGIPLFLVLVGDATKDYKDVLRYSAPDYVPTYEILSPVYASGATGKELVGSDHWYISALDGGTDDFPDMYVGRIPAGSVSELSSFIQKELAYENFSAQDAFRGTGVFFSDDAYSGSDWTTERYSLSEKMFKTISLAARDIVLNSPALPGFRADSLFLSAYLDTVPSTPKPIVVPLAPMQQYTRQNVTPIFLSRFSEGSLFVNFQGHANRYLATHEYIFVDNMRVYGLSDVSSLNNYGKPEFWTAFSCHFNDFEEENEDYELVGDCIGEKLLLLPDRGAIGVYASNAFEILPLSVYGDMNVALFDAFFGSPPTSDLRGKRGARWLLGEIIGSAEVRYLAGDYSNKATVETYVLLGDPGLRMDALAPQFAVTVDGSAVSPGATIYAQSDNDSVRIQALLNDEVAVDGSAISIEETGIDGRGTVSPSLYQITATADTVQGASRRFSLYYPTVLRAGTYDIVLHARDVNGRDSQFALRVALDVSFFDDRGRVIRDGSLVPPQVGVRAVVSSPIVLAQAELKFLVDGADSSASAAFEQADDLTGRNWEITLGLNLADGEHELAIDVGGIQRSVRVNVSSGFALSRLFVYPSPFERVTSFNYVLTGTPAGVLIEVFTISGRKLVEIRGTALVGENSVIWEGLDAEGDRVANGLYVYKITATDTDGRKITRLDKIVKVE